MTAVFPNCESHFSIKLHQIEKTQAVPSEMPETKSKQQIFREGWKFEDEFLCFLNFPNA
jgi:hypothetical protein